MSPIHGPRVPRLIACLLVGGLVAPIPPSAAVANEVATIEEDGDFPPQRGQASFYHPRNFTGRPMASGARFDPNSNSAAHRTLPFGTLVLVTNLETGLSRTVVIEDRGPHIRGRIIDVSPRVAEELGMTQAGVVPVEVRPVGRQTDQPREE